MTKRLKISESLSIPVDIVTDTNAVLARKGAGKTYTASVLAEEMIAAGQRCVVIDPTDAWWGLRAKADGSLNGLQVIIFGGRHADLPLDENMGAVIADLIVDRKVDSCILCTKGFESDAARIRFLTMLGARLFFRSQEPLHLFLDEADDYLPQIVTGETAKLVNVWSKIVKQGRLQGLGVTLISQRAAVINKNVLTQISTMFVLQTTGPQDIDAIKRWFRAKGDSHDEILDTLPRLKKGVCWVYSPEFLEIDPPQQIQVRERRTFNSSATPKVGERRVEPKGLAEVDLEALRTSLASTIAKVKAEDPKALQARVRELERELAKKAVGAPAAPPAPPPEQIEVPILESHEKRMLEHLKIEVESVQRNLAHLTEAIAKKTAPPAPLFRGNREPIRTEVRSITRVPNPHTRYSAPPASNGHANGLGKAERLILTALAQDGSSMNKRKLAAIAGYAIGGAFNNALGTLRSSGCAQGYGDDIQITETGRSRLGDYERLPEGRALLEWWSAKLGKAERAILETLSETTAPTNKEDLAQRAQYAIGGAFNNALGHLRTLSLVEGYGGQIRLSETLR